MKFIKTPILFLLIMTLLTGIIYPVTVAVVGQGLFKWKADGSLIEQDGKIIGSKLIGQQFKSKNYFHSRPSYAGEGYDAMNSGASNYAISNNELVFSINQSIEKINESGGHKNKQIPVDLIESSASGLDPHISLAGAYYQIPRIAKERKISGAKLKELIDENRDKKLLRIFGEDKVNVLLLNIKLDELAKEPAVK